MLIRIILVRLVAIYSISNGWGGYWSPVVTFRISICCAVAHAPGGLLHKYSSTSVLECKLWKTYAIIPRRPGIISSGSATGACSLSAPPSGTVTFLFTDIEGSTKRWEHRRDEMNAALARHDAVLRSAIEQQGGYVFKTVGDAFCAAFPTAIDAFQAAVQGQRSVGQIDWGEIGPLRVRMALHTGTAEERDGDYFGPPVNRVARILSAGYGGQTLLSAATQELVRDQMPPDTELRDLGEHRLKDLLRSEHIYQLVAPDTLSDFLPIKSLDSRPNNLPRLTTPLIGREHESAELLELLLRPNLALLTLTGPGGTGKTRLALQLAADALDEFEDGVWFVELAPLTDPDLVLPTIAGVLGVKESADRPLADAVIDSLRDKQTLLVLDNFEQVTGATSLVGALLKTTPRLKAIVTSRVPLRLYGEKEYLIPPLQLPDIKRLPPIERLTQYESVRLFIERAQDVKSDFEVTNENAPAVAEICVRLDGLPLAIEPRAPLPSSDAPVAVTDPPEGRHRRG